MINLIFIIDNNWSLQKYDNIETFNELKKDKYFQDSYKLLEKTIDALKLNLYEKELNENNSFIFNFEAQDIIKLKNIEELEDFYEKNKLSEKEYVLIGNPIVIKHFFNKADKIHVFKLNTTKDGEKITQPSQKNFDVEYFRKFEDFTFEYWEKVKGDKHKETYW